MSFTKGERVEVRTSHGGPIFVTFYDHQSVQMLTNFPVQDQSQGVVETDCAGDVDVRLDFMPSLIAKIPFENVFILEDSKTKEPKQHFCKCELNLLIAKGCQCGGL